MVKKNFEGTKIICEYTSSNIKKGVYDTETKKLLVTFNNGQIYEYDDVPHETFTQMNLAESHGKYFNTNVARKYNYRKIL